MDALSFSVSVSQMLAVHGSAQAPLLLDVRRDVAFINATHLIAGASWRDPGMTAEWARYLPRHRRIVVYCVHGHEISKNTTAALRIEGLDAAFLEGGIEAWMEAGGPTVRRTPLIPSPPNQPSRWITRERPKVDRIACPWLIRRFIDPFAEFLYLPAERVMQEAAATGSTAYDVPGVQFTHRGDRCSFDAFIDDHELAHPALNRLADIVRGADTDHPELALEAAGLHALSLGLSATITDDHAMLAQGMAIYDALYAWCRSDVTGKVERHNWNYPK